MNTIILLTLVTLISLFLYFYKIYYYKENFATSSGTILQLKANSPDECYHKRRNYG